MTNIGITKYKRWIRLNLSVTNSPFTEGQAKQINELLHTLSPNQQVWLSGYLMANQQSNTSTDSVEQHNLDDNTEAMLHEKEPSVEPEARSITILYGSSLVMRRDLQKYLNNVYLILEMTLRSNQWMTLNLRI